ncbi:Crp/Fnr family transcriptional regulator [Kibdelosporangium phytohabitans]|uniref:Crp/Fnr family transcriptional regulator n=1 Tax=Kibdelosporangium phytohabitans TaxID=860235 RepID=A0A0N9HPD4_9PSEU|nr:Crp/Fnr family transcriptional regulator [Kibdelosporangium phytohabitans]ALG06344.1 hypothetical protein AOZ06_04880 [Kibdelosporangium phytohabitans]MBE1467480.1 CRP-like cAMP-binding protein [Kibdelosporangium phytohabitans]
MPGSSHEGASLINELLAIAGKPVKFDRGAVIFRKYELRNERIFFIQEGQVHIVFTAADRTTNNLLHVLSSADMFGVEAVLDPGPRECTAVAATPVTLVGVERDALRQWMAENTTAALCLLGVLAQRIRDIEGRVVELVNAQLDQRLANVLLELAKRPGPAPTRRPMVVEGLTQEEIAHLIGATRENVNKALARFTRRGWLTLTRGQTKSVVILQPDHLEGLLSPDKHRTATPR